MLKRTSDAEAEQEAAQISKIEQPSERAVARHVAERKRKV